MRKIYKKILLVLLSLIIVFSTSACTDKKDEVSQQNTQIVADFENWAPDFQLIRLSSFFGKVTRNEDPQFVKSGKYSAKIQALGGYSTKYEPIMQIPMVSAMFQQDYSNFLWYDKISCSVYSEKADSVIKVAIVAGNGAEMTGGEKVLERKYKLVKGWNQVSYDINASLINLTKNARYINGISFAFDNVGSRELADATVMYLDDVQLTKRATEAVVTDIMELRPYEICDFEKLYQGYIVSTAGNSQIIPDLEIVSSTKGANDMLIKPTQGKKMLSVTLKAGLAVQGSLNYLIFPKPLMQRAFKSITREEISTGYLRFDVYNNGAAPTIFYPQFYNADGALVCAYDTTASSGLWKTFSVKLSDLEKVGVLPADKIGSMMLPYWEFTGEDRQFFFDNFRIEA